MAKIKSVNVPLSARQCNMLEELVDQSLAFMARALAAATTPGEAEFYRTQPEQFLPLKALFAKSAGQAVKGGGPQKVKLSDEQLLTLLGSLGRYVLKENLAISDLPAGTNREERIAQLDEWRALHALLDHADPRQHDHSQDADPDEDEEDESADAE